MTTTAPAPPPNTAATQPPPRPAPAPTATSTSWTHALIVIGAVAHHIVTIAARDRASTITALLIPINYLFLFLFTVINGTHSPLAVVTAPTPAAAQLVAALHHTDLDVDVMTGDEARARFTAGTVIAVLTIPAGFDSTTSSQASTAAPTSASAVSATQLQLQLNNANDDVAYDLRRSVLQGVNIDTAAGAKAPTVTVTEADLLSHTTSYLDYVLVSIVAVAIMIGGLFQGGVLVAREFEIKTIIDWILGRSSRLSLVIGLTLGVAAVSAVGAALVITAMVLAFRVTIAHPLELIGVCIILQLVFAAGGVAVGVGLRKRHGLSGLSILLSLPMLSLSGAFFPAPWLDPVIAYAALLSPTYYACGLLQHAVNDVEVTPTTPILDLIVLLAVLAGLWWLSTTLLRKREMPA